MDKNTNRLVEQLFPLVEGNISGVVRQGKKVGLGIFSEGKYYHLWIEGFEMETDMLIE